MKRIVMLVALVFTFATALVWLATYFPLSGDDVSTSFEDICRSPDTPYNGDNGICVTVPNGFISTPDSFIIEDAELYVRDRVLIPADGYRQWPDAYQVRMATAGAARQFIIPPDILALQLPKSASSFGFFKEGYTLDNTIPIMNNALEASPAIDSGPINVILIGQQPDIVLNGFQREPNWTRYDDPVYGDLSPKYANPEEHHQPIPEPGTLLLLGTGLAGAMFWMRKKKS